jgi:hypothetical protein
MFRHLLAVVRFSLKYLGSNYTIHYMYSFYYEKIQKLGYLMPV